jgi:iron complex outermembrane receptor protein
MRSFPGLPRNLLVFLISTQVLPVFAQEAAKTEPSSSQPPAAASEAAEESAPAAPSAGKIVITGAAIGMRQTRANVKITAADLDYYPPGVSADKVLERISGIQTGSSNAFGGDGFESTINMRGFGKDSIGFSVDGIPNGRTTLGGGSVPTRYFDPANLAGVDVSQSAGVIGSPSNQALVGHVNYLTDDPRKQFGARVEAAIGSADYFRSFARLDTGTFASGTSAYLSLSRDEWKVSYVPNPAGQNTREHVDFKLVKRFDNGAVVKLRSGYNDRQEQSGTNIVTLKQFNTDPTQDGYTDTWTGTPSKDRAYRSFKGNPRTDQLSYVEGLFPLSESLKLTAKAYYHEQEGVGKEASLGNAGFPGLDGKATSLYFRGNEYAMVRRGALSELAGKQSDLLDWRVGLWYELYRRSQVRHWYPVLDEASGPAWSTTPDATSEDKHWRDTVAMGYVANRSSFLEGRLKFDYGITYLSNHVDYQAPVQDSKTGKLNFVNRAAVSSGPLPQVGTVYALSDNTELFGGFAKNAASVTDATLEGGAATTLAAASTVNRMDTANAFDFGLRRRGDNYALGAQAFFIKSKETIASDIAGTLQSENVDQGRRIHGVEFTGNARLGDWRLYGALTLQRHRYVLEGTDAAGYPAKGFIRNGADLVGIAKENAFVEATWRAAEGLKLAMNGRYISSRAGYYANPRVANSGTDERLPAYTLFGFNASYAVDRITLGLNIENLTNKHYISGIAPELMTSPSTIGRYFIGAPRTVMLWTKLEL